MAKRIIQVLIGLTVGVAGIHISSLLAVLFFTAFLLIVISVVIPAVWSSMPARRKAAYIVLQQILDFLHRRAH